MGDEGGEPMPLRCTSIYLIIIQIIPLVCVFHLSYHKFFVLLYSWFSRVSSGRGRVVCIATSNGLDFRGFRTPGGGEILCTCPDRPRGSSGLLYNGYWVSFLGPKRPWRGVEHQPLSSMDIKEWVELYLYSPYLPLWHVIGWTLPSSLVKHCSPVMADGLTGCCLDVEHFFLVIVSYRLVTTNPFHIEM
jgi:hypothetical protein